MKLQTLTDTSFAKYGKILTGYELAPLLKMMEHTPVPENVIYVPENEQLESLAIAENFRTRGYGGLPIQIGYCNGNNHQLNALEYHRSSEINVAATDLVLLLGCLQDLTLDFKYDTSKAEAFFVPEGTAIELYATTLHYAPCTAVGKTGFRCVIILPKGTNSEIDFSLKGADDDQLATAKNKWLIAHPDAKIDGAHCGLIGENLSI